MIFDVYPVPLIIHGDSNKLSVGFTARNVSVLVKHNRVEAGEILDIYQEVKEHFLSSPLLEISIQISNIEIDLGLPIPRGLVVLNAPSPLLNEDGSYEYIPSVTGGVGPYSFVLDDTLPEGWTFNQATGALSGPPA